MKTAATIFLSVFMVLSSVHCQKPNPNLNKVNMYYTKGDPKKMVAGTELQPEVLTTQNYKEFNGYHIHQLGFFQQISKMETAGGALAKAAGKATSQIDVKYDERNDFNFEEIKVGEETKYKYGNSFNYNIIFSEKNGKLSVTEIVAGGVSHKLDSKIQHFSYNKEKEMFSLLIYSTEENATLAVFYFTKKFEFSPAKPTSGQFDFIAGGNLKIPWKQDKVALELCHPHLEQSKDMINQSLQGWGDYIRSVSFEVKINNHPPPFSDINSHCIYIVDDYLVNGMVNYSNPAATLLVLKNEIVDADIILFEKEFNKLHRSAYFEKPDERYSIWQVFTHEIGHFLGLGHPVNILHPSQPSIMSYSEDNQNTIYPHDVESITELYK